jgi:hypothetical protein
MERTKTLETSLVLTTGFLLIFIITQNELFLYISLGLGVTGIFFKPIAKYIAVAWFKLADILSYVTSKIILGILFFAVLFPVSILYKLLNNDKLKLKRSETSNWVERNHAFSASDIEKIW